MSEQPHAEPSRLAMQIATYLWDGSIDIRYAYDEPIDLARDVDAAGLRDLQASHADLLAACKGAGRLSVEARAVGQWYIDDTDLGEQLPQFVIANAEVEAILTRYDAAIDRAEKLSE